MLGNKVGTNERIMNISWRWFAAFAGLPAFFCLILTYLYIPESPRYLVIKGRVDEILSAIHKLNGSPRAVVINSSEEIGISKVEEKQNVRSLEGKPRWPDWLSRIFHLFQRPILRITLALIVCSYCLSFGNL